MPARPRRTLPSVPDVAEALAQDRPHLSTFIRGAAVGALVGAALAGSALLRRGRRTRGPLEAPGDDLPAG
jgi:hypothetical protein